jgi:hypothetical protein
MLIIAGRGQHRTEHWLGGHAGVRAHLQRGMMPTARNKINQPPQ